MSAKHHPLLVLAVSLVAACESGGGGGTLADGGLDSDAVVADALGVDTDASVSDSPTTDGDAGAAEPGSCAAPRAAVIGDNAGDLSAPGASAIGKGACGGHDTAPEEVFSFTPGATGEIGALLLTATPTEETADVVVYVRTACAGEVSELDCADNGWEGEAEALTVQVNGGVPVMIFVEAGSDDPASAGAFTLNVAYTQQVCGDRATTGTEECDDGGREDGDGCSAVCTVERVFYCADPAIFTGEAALGNTSAAGAALEGSCTGGGGARDQVFAYTPGVEGETGTVTMRLRSDTDQGFYVLTDCADEATEIACREDSVAGVDEVDVFAVDGGVQLSIVVDGFYDGAEAGRFSISANYVPDICGDGARTGREQCEDANSTAGDGCSATCRIELPFYCDRATAGALGSNSGDTSTHGDIFAGSCAGGFGGKEQLFTLTPGFPGEHGTVTLTLTSTEDLGVYARTACEDDTTEFGCADDEFGGTNEVLSFPVDGDVPITIFVDGATADSAGAFSLDVQYVVTG